MLRSWNAFAAAAALYLGIGAAAVARAGDRPAAESPPAAENILEEVTLQNSKHYAAPPSPMRRQRVFPLQLRNVTVENKGSSQIRVKLPSNQAPLTPAVADGKVFVGGGFNSSEFYCLATDTGRPIWGLRLSDPGPSAPAYNRGTLSFTTESCTLYVVDAATGNCLWSTWLGDPLITAPTIVGDRVLVCYPATAGGGHGVKPPANFVFAARDLRTGKPLWQKWIDENIISAPVVSDDDVYLTTFAGTLYGFRLDNGEVELARRCRGTSAPVVSSKAIYLSRRVDKGGSNMPMECVAKLDRRTGEPLLASEARGAVYLADAESRARLSGQQRTQSDLTETSPLLLRSMASTPFRLVAMETAVPGDADYVPGGTPEVADARPDSIKLIGRTGAMDLQRFDGSRLAMTGGKLFNCMGDDLQSVDPRTGKVHWSVSLSQRQPQGGEPAALPPVAVAGRLYVATRAGELLRVSPRDGSIDGRVALGAAAATQPVFDDGRIVVGTVSGELIMLKSKDHKLTGWNQWGGGAAHSGIDNDDPGTTDDGLFSDEGEPRAARTGQDLVDATRASLKKFAKTTDKTAEKAREEFSLLNRELEHDTVLPRQQRDTLRFAVKRRQRQLDVKP
jgi:outer membrane protein assembly factor BamB